MSKIMVIDDDIELIENLTLILESENMTICSRDQLEGAIGALIKEEPELLILDVMFPENPAGGFDLAREIRKTSEIKELPIILLTAVNQELPTDFSADDIDEEWMPVQDLMEKPVDFQILKVKIKKILGK